jgi:hypothetical protein
MINIVANKIMSEAFYECKINLTQLRKPQISLHKNSDNKIKEIKNDY